MTQAWRMIGAWLVLGLGACASGQAASSKAGGAGGRGKEAQAYYPLKVGNRWTYEADLLGEKSERTVEIVSEEGGFFKDSQGGRLTFDSLGVRDDRRYLLRGPLKAGQTWSNVVSASSTEHYSVLEAGGHCESPAGVFERCVTVEGRSRIDDRATLVNQLTFAKGVGLVRVEVMVEEEGRKVPQSSLALKQYALSSSAGRNERQ